MEPRRHGDLRWPREVAQGAWKPIPRSARWMRRTSRISFLRFSSCSQIRSPRQPPERRVRDTSRSRVRLVAICGRLRPAGARQRPPLRSAAGPRLRRDHLRAAALRFCARKRRWFWATWRGACSRARSSRRRRRRGGAPGRQSRVSRETPSTSSLQLSTGAKLLAASR